LLHHAFEGEDEQHEPDHRRHRNQEPPRDDPAVGHLDVEFLPAEKEDQADPAGGCGDAGVGRFVHFSSASSSAGSVTGFLHAILSQTYAAAFPWTAVRPSRSGIFALPSANATTLFGRKRPRTTFNIGSGSGAATTLSFDGPFR